MEPLPLISKEAGIKYVVLFARPLLKVQPSPFRPALVRSWSFTPRPHINFENAPHYKLVTLPELLYQHDHVQKHYSLIFIFSSH